MARMIGEEKSKIREVLFKTYLSKKRWGGCPLFSLDATGDRALFKPVQLNWGGRVSAL